MNFLEAAIKVLKDNKNIPMTSKEIWNKISEDNLIKTDGKTPHLSLNTVMLRNCVDSPLTEITDKTKGCLLIKSKSPYKFCIKNYCPDDFKELLTENGFITKDELLKILSEYDLVPKNK